METGKSIRLLELYEELTYGSGIHKKEAAARFGVNERSIQRDIELLRNFFADQDPPKEIWYNAKENTYQLTSSEKGFLTNGEMLAVCKILLESRSMVREEMVPIIDKLLSHCVSNKDRKAIGQLLVNERFYYIEPHHGTVLTEKLWVLGQSVRSQHFIRVHYRTQSGQKKIRKLKPVGLMFSEFYFYLTAFIDEIDRKLRFENADDPYPTIYRVDRLDEIMVLNEHFSIPYSERFSEGEFRKRVQFMYGGKLQTVRFTYTGPSIEAVLDRLPTAVIQNERDGVYTVEAEVFGKGIELWLKGQGDCIEIL